MAFGMFCAVPMPYKWDDSSAKYVMPFLPFVGVLIGAIWWGAAELLVLSGIHILLAAALLMLITFIAAGFIHLDGYIDTSDAILSRRSLEEKQRILKDPYSGAFAVIMVAILFILQFAAAFAVIENGKFFKLLIIIPVISRCCTAMFMLCLRPMAKGGYANLFRPAAAAPHRIFTIMLTVCAFVLSWFLAGVFGIIISGAVVLGCAIAMACASISLKGVSGDLAGFSLVAGELCGIIAMAVVQ